MTHILQLSPYAPQQLNEELAQVGPVVKWWELGKPAVISPHLAEQITMVATKGDLGLPTDLMMSLVNLRFIGVYGVGVDRIDLKQAREKQVRISTTADLLTDAVAEFAVTLVLNASRRIVEGDRFIRAGRWSEAKLGTGFSVAGKTAGVLGYGRIGRRTADLLQVLGMNVLYSDLKAVEGNETAFRENSLQLAKESRVLIVCLPGSQATEGLVDRAVMDALGNDGLLVNVARGSVVQETDLIDALQERTLGHAALDVFSHEPNVPKQLIESEYCTLTPHIASATLETRLNMGRNVIANLQAFKDETPLVSELNF